MLGLLKRKRVEENGDNEEHLWVQFKRAMFESAREVCVSLRMGGGGDRTKKVCGGTMR